MLDQIKYVTLNLNIVDDEDADIYSLFQQCFDFIEKARQSNHRVLVHCFQGVSRSATIILAYLLQSKAYSNLEDAIADVKFKRPLIRPNDGFKSQLKKLVADINKTK